MAYKTDEELSDQAQQIINEDEIGGNTKERVGQLFQDIVDSKPNIELQIDGGTPSENLRTIQTRGGIASDWTSANPVLAAREMGVETDTRKHKFGDGTTAWNSLDYAGSGGVMIISWDFSANAGAYPTDPDALYVVSDASVLPFNTWMVANTPTPSGAGDFYYK